jgi:hypothetical protein
MLKSLLIQLVEMTFDDNSTPPPDTKGRINIFMKEPRTFLGFISHIATEQGMTYIPLKMEAA